MADPNAAAAFISELQQLQIGNYIDTAGTALMLYDYLITFEQERKTIWQRKFSGATLLFLLNRYLALLYGALSVTTDGVKSVNCTGVIRLSEAVSLVLFFVFAGFSALRVYALWNRNIALFFLIFTLNLVPVATNIYYFSTITPIPTGLVLDACQVTSTRSQIVLTKITKSTRLCAIVADALVLIFTWMKTWSIQREARRVSMKVSITTLLLRDGTIYFTVLLAANIAQIVVSDYAGVSYISPIVTFIPLILVSRFIMNLRDNNTPSQTEMENLSQFSAPAFAIPANITGNLGEPLNDFDMGDEDPEGYYSDSQPASDSGRSREAVTLVQSSSSNSAPQTPIDKTADVEEVVRNSAV